MSLSGNKGEWSEVYVLLKLLAEGCLHPGDATLSQVKSVIYPIIEVLREHSSGWTSYIPQGRNIRISAEGEEDIIIPIDTFASNASQLFEEIIKINKSTESLPTIEPFLRQIGCKQIKTKSSSKADIHIKIHDQRSGMEPTLGFSIKSQLGSSATLLNASKATNFVFSTGLQLTAQAREDINAIEGRGKVQARIDALRALGGELTFLTCESICFLNNLKLVDSSMPIILASLLQLYYLGKGSRLIDLLPLLKEINPLGFDQTTHSFYEYKLKKLLVEIALGLQPNSIWDGRYDATGGYLIVKESGDIVCYHFYDRNLFEDYLLHNTKLDTPSTSRHNFGQITEDGQIKLNLQLRFI